MTLFRWVQRFTPLLIDAARPYRHAVGDRRFVDETYVKVAGVWRYVHRAVDQYGQVIDVYVPRTRDIAAARRFFTASLATHGQPVEVVTDRAAALARVIGEPIPAAFHNTRQYENKRGECDHGRLKARLRPMQGLKTNRTASVVIRGHALIQNLRRGHYDLGTDTDPVLRLATAFDERRLAIWPAIPFTEGPARSSIGQRNSADQYALSTTKRRSNRSSLGCSVKAAYNLRGAS